MTTPCIPKLPPQSGLPVPDSTSSFWHTEPSTFLLNHHTTLYLPPSASIVIIGSGITGTSAARFLAADPRAASKSVVMLEAREACWGATGRNGGHCQPELFDRTVAVAEFELKNVEEVRRYIEEEGIECEWRQVVACRTFWKEEFLKEAVGAIESLRKSHPEIGKLVRATMDDKELAEYHVKEGCVGATLTQGAGCLWPYKYVTFILEKLVKGGKLNLQTNTPVTSMETFEGKTRLHTPYGSIVAEHVIMATNGYTSHLLNIFSSLIVPVRCEMSALIPPKGSDRLPASYGFVAAHGQNPVYSDYLIQRPFYQDINGLRKGGHLMFGGGRGAAEDPCVGVWEDDVIDQGEATYLRKGLLDTLQFGGNAPKADLKELRASHQWTGIKGYSRDNTPWVGRVPGTGSNVWLAGGYTGHGMPNATLCGRAVVEMALAVADGKPLDEVEQKLISSGDLPAEYLITEERISKALELPTVEVLDANGLRGNQSADSLDRAGEKGAGGAPVEISSGGATAKNGKEGRCDLM